MSTDESGHITRQYAGTNISHSDCHTNANDSTRCVDFHLPTQSEVLGQVLEWKWKKYHKCSVDNSSKSVHSTCGTDGYCCRTTENFCPVGALKPIRDFDSGSAVSFKPDAESLK